MDTKTERCFFDFLQPKNPFPRSNLENVRYQNVDTNLKSNAAQNASGTIQKHFAH